MERQVEVPELLDALKDLTVVEQQYDPVGRRIILKFVEPEITERGTGKYTHELEYLLILGGATLRLFRPGTDEALCATIPERS